MKNLWAPWRMDYIREEGGKGCIFCRNAKVKKDKETLILYRGRSAFVIMNKFPYNSGHVMVVPKRHCVDLSELGSGEALELFRLLRASTEVLKNTLRPCGFNIGINLGKAGGAGMAHLHIHVVPRWTGDTNFMPVLSETRVMPEYLYQTYEKLSESFQEVRNRRRRKKGGGNR